LEIIVAAEDSGIPYQMCKGFTVGILGAALQSAELTPRTSKQEDLLARVLEYCSNHYKEKLLLSDLANQFYVNQSGLSRLFNHGLGLSFNDFINLIRVEEAAHLLKTTTLTISQIAFEVGFGNVRTMNRAFLKHRNVAPCTLRSAKRNTSDREESI
jgi:transcriptional regulator GlxA family with amidase domain